MTQTSVPKHARNQRTSVVIHGGQSKVVIVHSCSNCGYKLQTNKVECATILTRFKCPECGQSIENTNENRCKVCDTMCCNSDAYNAHKWGGCPYAGTLYPYTKKLRYRDENLKVTA